MLSIYLNIAASSFGPQDILPLQHSLQQSISNGASQSVVKRKPIRHCALATRCQTPQESATRNLNTYGSTPVLSTSLSQCERLSVETHGAKADHLRRIGATPKFLGGVVGRAGFGSEGDATCQRPLAPRRVPIPQLYEFIRIHKNLHKSLINNILLI